MAKDIQTLDRDTVGVNVYQGMRELAQVLVKEQKLGQTIVRVA